MVGIVPLVPLEPFEWLELSGEFSVLEFVFLRRNSLKKGIVRCRCKCRCHAACPKRMYVSNCLKNDKCAHGEGRAMGMLMHWSSCRELRGVLETSDLEMATRQGN